MSDLTPLMKQYRETKARYPDAILFFRVGDFYEMFFEDAVNASKILEIALTSRDKSKEDSVPLCGIPYHAASTYIAKLIRAGKSVAICDQVEDPRQAKGLVRREVVRVITPGTLIEPDLMDSRENNYLASVSVSKTDCGLAFVDLSTGEFHLTQFDGATAEEEVLSELARLEPKEILIAESDLSRFEAVLNQQTFAQSMTPRLCRFTDTAFDPGLARRALLEHFKLQSLAGFGCEEIPIAVAAAGALLRYLQETQLTALGHLNRLRRYRRADHLILDSTAQRNLELTRRLIDGRPEGSLLWALDRTLTPMGARLLRNWLLQPLLDIGAIRARQTAIEMLLNETPRRGRLRAILKGIADLERIIGRISLGTANARDLVQLKNSIEQLPSVYKCLTEPSSSGPEPEAHSILESIRAEWDDLTDIHSRIRQTLADAPPPGLREGGLIRDGVDPALDELIGIARDGKRWISALEAKERERTGIDSLKVRYNQVFGFYIEVTKTHLSRVPPDFYRKQTLVNAERFITPELKELETKVLGAEEQSRILEFELFERLRKEVAAAAARIQAVARSVGRLDVLSALAEVAATEHYVKPEVDDGDEIRIVDGRHPMLERMLPKGSRFIPNDALIDRQDNRLLIITGPNMAGKSTYMRQVALIVILAQTGSFVPAAEARIGRVDRIFTRIGASDDLMGGQSTFMVEMTEMAAILHQSTARSLILLDEIGRGTSTFDGLSIAWAVAEYLHHPARSGARTLFATHYHQLTELALTFSGIKNYNIAVREWNDEIIFLRKIVAGGTDRSYGIQVARLAGLPPDVIRRAKEILYNLENGELNELGQPRLASHLDRPSDPTDGDAKVPGTDQFNLFNPAVDPVANEILQELRKTETDRLTPLEALNLLHGLKKKAEGPHE
ncbi:MAG TPA: DNA mismatch repair protein MutS [Nitrospiria bacterium]|nr:DNA mismatch repair protein MutS [Nitrospiria bacterium]